MIVFVKKLNKIALHLHIFQYMYFYLFKLQIPFSKFYLTSCGRIQDQQHQLVPNRIRHIGITLGDGAEGPFQLEIDYIALLRDDNAELNDFEYEMYRKDPYIV